MSVENEASITENVMVSRRFSRLEINFVRLAARCEQMALDTENCTNPENWRLGKFVEALEWMLQELKHSPNSPDKDQIQFYSGRVEFLKGVLSTAKLPTLQEKVITSQLIQPSQNSTLQASPVLASPMEIKHRHHTKYSEDLRKELLGDSPIQGVDTGNENLGINDLVKYHHSIQEKIADHMLDLTRTLKEQVSLAGHVVKKDTENLEKSSKLIERNEGNLKKETQKLDRFNRGACKCWIWLMLLVVCSIFVAPRTNHTQVTPNNSVVEKIYQKVEVRDNTRMLNCSGVNN